MTMKISTVNYDDIVSTDDLTTSDIDYALLRVDGGYVVRDVSHFDFNLCFSVFIGVLLALIVSGLIFGGGNK